MQSRRRILHAAGVGLAGLAGCLDTDPGGDDSSPRDRESPESASPSDPPPSETPVTDSPGPVKTPPPGECAATDPPMPDTGEHLRDPRSYPEGPPEMTADAVTSFLEAYQTAHATNELLAELAVEGRCLDYLDVAVDGFPRVQQTDAGFDVTVAWFRGYRTTRCETPTGTDTPSPAPHADYWGETRYVVTDRFLVRAGTTLECW